MSLREMKDEFKQTEGEPIVKGKIRQLRQERARQRMMAAVPKASFIITNPPTTPSPCNTTAAWRRQSASPGASMRWR